MGKHSRWRNRRLSRSFYVLLAMVCISAWQYVSSGGITWPTRAASTIEELIRRGTSQASIKLADTDRQGANDATRRAEPSTAQGFNRPGGPAERPSFLSRARVTRVVDGDSVELSMDGKTERVRMLCLDAPEYGQAFGSAARRHLAALIGDKAVLIEEGERDRYDRLLAKLYPLEGDTSLNWQMVRDGYAWDNQLFPCGGAYRQAERSARTESVGLWRDNNPVPPWDWRESKRQNDRRGG